MYSILNPYPLGWWLDISQVSISCTGSFQFCISFQICAQALNNTVANTFPSFSLVKIFMARVTFSLLITRLRNTCQHCNTISHIDRIYGEMRRTYCVVSDVSVFNLMKYITMCEPSRKPERVSESQHCQN